ncbi:hypothetical protein COU56_04055 [Candidatus Pacearchaeota archaeon CG10_big_fil_rev_8_21_14_0_10_31_9]|nr:MAG: hypothetical protein AUJ62_00150 [Candidatus Pacearchaeota archaeon CG1_02_32_21]PIN92726.1 MAG: hypothetical protein COU56_04055 [Candidatus Pacearchaeota archaeon CG10_big_fil_rev_8_21_14_0_10_31_9]PIZ82829.1 MAG: hypothetical protein COX97_02930 [Candidatus Pacearchaeota archaeon CG_4_10_14_0_2_um_filter_05_32_18]
MGFQDVLNGVGNSPQVAIPYDLIDRVEVSGNTVWMNRENYDLGKLGRSIPQNYYGRGDVELYDRDADKVRFQGLLDNPAVSNVGFRQID